MQLENVFTVPTGIDDAWVTFNDPTWFAPCFPGAAVESYEGDSFAGTVKVKLGPISLTYQGTGTYLERDDVNHSVVIDAEGRETRGNGTASAKVTGSLTALAPDETEVKMITDITVIGRPAQFGRRMMVEVSDEIIAQFASCLSTRLASEVGTGTAAAGAGAEKAAPTASSAAASSTGGVVAIGTVAPTAVVASTNGAAPKLVSVPESAASEVEAFDLIDPAGSPMLKRAVSVFLASLLLFVVLRRIKNR